MSASNPPETAEIRRPAGLFRRLAAVLYDALLVLAIWMFITLAVILLKSAITGTDAQALSQVGVEGWIFKVCLVLITFGFFAFFWIRSRRTLGMQVWHLEIEDERGGAITIQQAIKRFLGATLSFTCGGLGYLWILLDKDSCAWHDRLSGTRIKRIPKKNNRSR